MLKKKWGDSWKLVGIEVFWMSGSLLSLSKGNGVFNEDIRKKSLSPKI